MSHHPSGLSFRRMAEEDVEIVHAIDVESFALPWPKTSFQHEITQNPAARFWLAEHSETGKPPLTVGMLGGWLVVDEFHIGTIAVRQAWRRQHIGAGLLKHGIQQVFTEGARMVFLEVRESNLAAQAMYKKFGFIVEGVRPRYYSDNHETAIIMNLYNLNQHMISSWNMEERKVNLDA